MGSKMMESSFDVDSKNGIKRAKMFNLCVGLKFDMEARGTTYQACPKVHVKRVFFHNSALYVRNVNRSNSCKISLKGYR